MKGSFIYRIKLQFKKFYYLIKYRIKVLFILYIINMLIIMVNYIIKDSTILKLVGVIFNTFILLITLISTSFKMINDSDIIGPRSSANNSLHSHLIKVYPEFSFKIYKGNSLLFDSCNYSKYDNYEGWVEIKDLGFELHIENIAITINYYLKDNESQHYNIPIMYKKISLNFIETSMVNMQKKIKKEV